MKLAHCPAEMIPVKVVAGERETSGVTTQLILGYVRERGGDAAVGELLRRAGVSETRDELEDESRWTSYATRIRLFEAAVEVLDDPRCTYEMGATSLRLGLSHSVVLVLRALGSPRQVYRQLPRSVPKFSTTSTMEIVECDADSAVFRYTLHEGYPHSRLDCLYAQGLMTVVPVIFGLPSAELVHDECEADGAPACVYRLRWRHRSRWPFRRRATQEDPELRALRGQLQKLQSAASELVGEGDLDTVLRRITDRAGAAVLAPAHLLAVRDPETDRPLVHSSGLPDSDVDELAERLLAGEDLGDSVVAVEVRSARRLHGRLAAIYPAGQRGPANERPMLTAYAGHAAAALDLLVALQDSRRGESRASALLALAHQLRSASDARTVSEVVVAMLPQIVGCDTSSVRLWDAAAGQLQTLAASGLDPDEQMRMDATPIRADETPELISLLTRHETVVVATEQASPSLRAWLESLTLEGFAVTPLLADQTLLGVATACWRPGQMPVDNKEVLARLRGVGEYAATALQNARLWSTVQHQSLHDALTGLPNRLLLTRTCEEMLAGPTAERGVTVLFCDLDRFKHVNDSWGHSAGDELLRQVAARLLGILRPGDMVGRLSGDEFALLLPGVAEPDVATGIAERVLTCFSEPFRIEGRKLPVTTSVGVATHVGAGGRVEELLRDADAGMYAAKQRGRNQFGFVRRDDRDTAPELDGAPAPLEMELRGALARGELRLFFQPVVEIVAAEAGEPTRRLAGAEALLRWEHPRLGILAPAAFLSLAEELGLVADFDLWAVRAACRALDGWSSDGEPLHVAVNLSSAALLDPRLHDTVRAALNDAGIAPHQLHLEVVESRALLDVPAVVEHLVELRRLGAVISLDDFGTGFSTLSWLQRLPVDQVKVDRTFTAELGHYGPAQALVRGIVALARELGVEVVAEGVETDEQLRELQQAGCHLFQGYLLGRPTAQPPVLSSSEPAHLTSRRS
jgi:diguanylate cyclase (GGDEF)-like protein